MLGKLLQPELEELLHKGEYATLRETLQDMDPPDVVEMIEELPSTETALLFRILPRTLAADVFEYLPLEDQDELLKAMGQEQIASLLNEMDPDDRTALLEELPAEVTRRLLALLSPEELLVAKQLLGYPEESIGRRMTTDYVSISPDWTCDRVLAHIRAHGKDSETINVLYIVDAKNHLIDDIRLREILLAPPERIVRDLMDHTFVSLRATDDQETAVTMFKKYDRVVLPVIDSGGVLVGIVTVDDVLDVAEEEATEDIHKLGGLEALDLPYFSTHLGTMIRKRAGWLVLLFLGELLTATAMGFFEKEIEKMVVLALFVPLIISSGGNSGSQAASLIIRALALGEVTLADWWRVVHREVLTGLALGAILGAVGFLRISIWSAFSTIYGAHWLMVAFTIWFALIGVVLWGTLAGSLLPLIMKRVGADPATSSAPFVATLVDVTGLVIYFSIASVTLMR
ncbi:magnesium transporter [bacterium]|nr:magnesium transporter [bacterium]